MHLTVEDHVVKAQDAENYNTETIEVTDVEDKGLENDNTQTTEGNNESINDDVLLNLINIEAIVKRVKLQKLNEKYLVRLDTETKSLQEMQKILEKTRKNLEIAKIKNKPYYEKIVENIQKDYDFAESNFQKNNKEIDLLIQEKKTLEKNLINLYKR